MKILKKCVLFFVLISPLFSITYEWEKTPDYTQSKEIFVNSFADCYRSVPLEALRKSSFEELTQWLGDAFDESYQSHLMDQDLKWLSAKENGQLVGFLLVDLKNFPEEVYLAQMAVDLNHQRQGIATSMVSALFEQMPEVKKFTVITRIVNEAARTFYLSLGFAASSYIHEGYSRELYTGYEYQK